MKLIEKIARDCQWHKTVNFAFEDACNESIRISEQLLPHGSGFDNGCFIDVGNSGNKRVHIPFEYHHMNDHGYCGWTSHEAIITADFSGADIRITGPNKNGCKDYFYDVLHECLEQDV